MARGVRIRVMRFEAAELRRAARSAPASWHGWPRPWRSTIWKGSPPPGTARRDAAVADLGRQLQSAPAQPAAAVRAREVDGGCGACGTPDQVLRVFEVRQRLQQFLGGGGQDALLVADRDRLVGNGPPAFRRRPGGPPTDTWHALAPPSAGQPPASSATATRRPGAFRVLQVTRSANPVAETTQGNRIDAVQLKQQDCRSRRSPLSAPSSRSSRPDARPRRPLHEGAERSPGGGRQVAAGALSEMPRRRRPVHRSVAGSQLEQRARRGMTVALQAVVAGAEPVLVRGLVVQCEDAVCRPSVNVTSV